MNGRRVAEVRFAHRGHIWSEAPFSCPVCGRVLRYERGGLSGVCDHVRFAFIDHEEGFLFFEPNLKERYLKEANRTELWDLTHASAGLVVRDPAVIGGLCDSDCVVEILCEDKPRVGPIAVAHLYVGYEEGAATEVRGR